MPRPEKPTYFGAGPAVLPTSVLKQAAADLVQYKDNSVGIGEISHRLKDAAELINETVENVKAVLNVPDTHTVLFLQGGGTSGFSSIATNLLAWWAQKTGKKGQPGYIVTGTWSKKAFEEAQRLGAEPYLVTKPLKFVTIPNPQEWTIKEGTPYVYYCDNETVNGVEFSWVPEVEPLLVADMLSNFLSKEVDVSKFGVIFGGAQKNIGIAGLSLYIVRNDLLEQAPAPKLLKLGIPVGPIALDWPIVAKNNSAYNTIPIFTLHVLNLVLRGLKQRGLKSQEQENKTKAELVYAALDKRPDLFTVPVEKPYRSRMNVIFTLPKEKEFLEGAEKKGLSGLKGHRSVGGMRASLYNAVGLDQVKQLVEYIENFE